MVFKGSIAKEVQEEIEGLSLVFKGGIADEVQEEIEGL